MANMTQEMYGAQGNVGNMMYYYVATLTSSKFFRSVIKRKMSFFFVFRLLIRNLDLRSKILSLEKAQINLAFRLLIRNFADDICSRTYATNGYSKK